MPASPKPRTPTQARALQLGYLMVASIPAFTVGVACIWPRRPPSPTSSPGPFSTGFPCTFPILDPVTTTGHLHLARCIKQI